MKIDDVRAKSDDELVGSLLDLKREQFNLRFQQVAGQLQSPGRIREVRRAIARIKSVQGERTRSAASQGKE